MKIKKNDNVIMLSGKDRGKTGKINLVLPESGKVVVEGLNLIKKHVRARKQGQKGQVISKERSVSASSVALVCRSCGKPTRIGYKIVGDPAQSNSADRQSDRGRTLSGARNKIRICKKCKAEI